MHTLTYTLFLNLSKTNYQAGSSRRSPGDSGLETHLKLLGIADDFTGASDLALMLAQQGMPVTQVIGQPEAAYRADTPAVVIALKIRSCPAVSAIEQSLRAAEWGLGQSAQQLFFKYCSTFDSTPGGNIGPVTDALLQRLDAELTVLCPAFPDNGRTVNNGLLYVNGVPLGDSPMRHHPLNPMMQSNLLQLMDEQTNAGASGLVPLSKVREGKDAIAAELDKLRSQGRRFAVIDALTNADLLALGHAVSDMKVVTGAAGLAMGLPANFGYPGHSDACISLPALQGHPVVIAGSCSSATRAQVAHMQERHWSLQVDPLALANGEQSTGALCQQAEAAWQQGPVVIHSAAQPQQIQQAQQVLGTENAAAKVEAALSAVARHLADAGAQKFIIAGGETSGAVATALQLKALRTGPAIAPGVPWMLSDGSTPLLLAFKSGNFGAEDFFQHAMGMLP
jgi:uncharacterized protein YgbK (DUF1537 family)